MPHGLRLRLAALTISLFITLAPNLPARAQEAPPAPRDRFFGVDEAFRNVPSAIEAGAAWERLIFSWQYLQPWESDQLNIHYFPDSELDALNAAGFDVVGLLQDTPEWARLDPEAGATSVPVGLELAWDDPGNAWGHFVFLMAERYRGRIDNWIIWNEPEFRPDDQGGIYLTFSGGDEDYYRLLKVAYQAIKAANPEATVLTGATSYWIDRVNGRTQYVDRLLSLAAEDPEAAESGGFFDAVALNLYWSADDIRRVGLEYRDLLASYGFPEKGMWITETNSMPYDDPVEPKPWNGQRVTLEDQAAFVIQAYATALATGYARVSWHAMTDRDTTDEIWGLVRNDGSPRPALRSYQVASTWLSSALAAEWAPLDRATWRPSNGGDYSNVSIYRVVVARPNGQRVTVLWNGEGTAMQVQVPRTGATAQVLDKRGELVPFDEDPSGESWLVTLPAATTRAPNDPEGYYFAGGDPLLLVEEGVPDDAVSGDLGAWPI